MTVKPTGSTAPVAAPAVKRAPVQAEVNAGHDGDADDGGASRVTVNASGQTLGKLVNTKA